MSCNSQVYIQLVSKNRSNGMLNQRAKADDCYRTYEITFKKTSTESYRAQMELRFHFQLSYHFRQEISLV